jgi:toxin FitB
VNLVDSSGWIEYFLDLPGAGYFAAFIEDEKKLLVPSISLYEVFRKLLVETDETTALQAVTQMQLGKVIALDEPLALNAARLGYDLNLPLADSIILATAYRFNATLYTMEEHFKGQPGVKYFPRNK